MMSHALVRRGFLAVVAWWLLAVGVAHAQQVPVRPGSSGPPPGGSRPAPQAQVQPTRPEAPPGRVAVEVTVVFADKSGRVDPRLTALKRQFEMMNLTGFSVLAHHDASLTVGQDTAFNVEGDRRLQLTLVARDAAVARVRIQMFTGGVLKVDSTSRLPRGESVTVAGPPYRDGRLIYLIGVDY
jgi:hypothetical protein